MNTAGYSPPSKCRRPKSHASDQFGSCREDLPGSRDVLERHFAALLERDAGADDQVLHRPRGENLSGLGVLEESRLITGPDDMVFARQFYVLGTRYVLGEIAPGFVILPPLAAPLVQTVPSGDQGS